MPREKTVELIPDTSAASGWKVKHDGKTGSNPKPGKPDSYPVVDVGKDSGPHLIVFELPKNGSTATFNADHPIAIQSGTASPQPDAGLDPQFPAAEIFDNGKSLAVFDRNSGTGGDYAYSIKVDGYAKVLDPIITNGGGTTPPPPPPPPPVPPGKTTTGAAAAQPSSTGQSLSDCAMWILVAAIIAFILGYLVGRRKKAE